ncbi:MAG: hypothetical protein JW763_03410 [candidate division Zixibacteria bacterium]|nr:hypothetical protein [candidate division Zixibacteria bacterium]
MKRGVLLIIALLLAIYSIGFWGCTKEVEGPERINQPPIVQFVNIPVSGSQFSSDTTIYWYGTDVDGFIRYFRYAVIESTVVGGDPLGYIYGNKADIDWTVLEVTLENPNSNAKVNMSADVKDPVRKFVSSYVFLQAIDNLGEESDIIYRMFRKNNHFPVTKVNFYSIGSPFINAQSSDGILPGIEIKWSATDPVDYPRDAPPFEYRWKFYGPYDSLEMEFLNENYLQAYFVDDYGHYYLEGDTLARMVSADTAINTTVTPPETTITPVYEYYPVEVTNQDLRRFDLGTWDTLLLGVYGEIDSTALPEDSLYLLDSLPMVDPETYLVEESNGWLYDVERARIYDAFRKDPSPDSVKAITRQRYFFFTCQARDDSKVPDNAPDFRWISVVEPKYERDIILLDWSNYKSLYLGINAPIYKYNTSYPIYDGIMLKDVYSNLANAWKPGCFDSENLLPNDTINGALLRYSLFLTTQDYFAPGNIKDFASDGVPNVKLTDILRHKVIIITKDDAGSAMDFSLPVGSANNAQYITSFVVSGLNSGMSAWSMLRGPFYEAKNYLFRPFFQNIPSTYAEYFGIDGIWYTTWGCWPLGSLENPLYYRRIEDFIGAHALSNPYMFDMPATPEIDTALFDFAIDSAMLKDRYIWYPGINPWMDTLWALPEVGYVVKDGASKALYEYISIHDTVGYDLGNYQGRVVACARKTQVYKTIHYSFNLLAIDSITAQKIFNETMDWLTVQPFLQTGKMDRTADAQVSVQKLRSIQQDIEDNRRLTDEANAIISDY